MITWQASARPAHGFVAHWVASRAWLEGEPLARLYDDVWFGDRVHAVEPGITDIFGANPPTVALVAAPVAWLPYDVARRITAVSSLALWLAAAVWLGRVLALRGAWAPGLLCLAAVFQPAVEGLRHAQLHMAMFLLILMAWRAWRRASPAGQGLPLGAALALKMTGTGFWLVLLAQRRWRGLLWAGAMVGLLVLVSWPAARIEAWSSFSGRAQQLAGGGSLRVTAYQSLPGLLQRLTAPHPRWNPAPLFDAPVVGVVLAWLAALLLGAITMRMAARRSDDATFAAFAALSVELSPVSLDYHYVLLLLPIGILLARQQVKMRSAGGVLLLVAAALIASPLPYTSPRLADGVAVLLAYPKLYGALLLWWLALRS
jgi:alpha-1,2-mannosyltransferase